MYTHVVMPDPEQKEINASSTFFVSDPNRLRRTINECAGIYPQFPIVVFKLDCMQKMVRNPEFAMYKMDDNGEFIPV